MKALKLASITSLIVISTSVFSEVIENSQIMPPPGPYKSVMNGQPPAFVPYGSRQAQSNPYQQNNAPQAFNKFPADTRAMYTPSMQAPEWVISRQQENKERIEKMFKDNEIRNKENETTYKEHLKNSQALANKREEERKQWILENNKRMKLSWENMLKQYSKEQKQQIKNAENLPDWVKDQMLKQHEQQIAVMSSNQNNSEDAKMMRQRQMNNQQNHQFYKRRPDQQNPDFSNRHRFNQPMMPSGPAMRQPYQQPPVFNRTPPAQRNIMPRNRTYAPQNRPVQANNGWLNPAPSNQYPR